ncbi:MAG: succinate--CoA ligase subunit alpha [Thermodesulfobacteriota bacterium]
MSILVNRNSKVIVQGITGSAGLFHAQQCRDYGTQVVGGVTPGKGGSDVDGFSVFNTVSDAVKATGANVSLIFVPAPFAMDSILEAVDGEIEIIICITEGIPTLDIVKVKEFMKGSNSRLIGPNCPGVITPGEAKVGIMPGYIHKPGKVGIISRSGTLTYEAVWQTTNLEIGQSTCIGIGGDPVIGTTFIDALQLFQNDPDTDGVIMIGEIGGSDEEEAAEYIKDNFKKPIAAFIAGSTAPKGKRMGHAGAIISGSSGSAEDKFAALEKAGVATCKSPAAMGETLKEVMGY